MRSPRRDPQGLPARPGASTDQQERAENRGNARARTTCRNERARAENGRRKKRGSVDPARALLRKSPEARGLVHASSRSTSQPTRSLDVAALPRPFRPRKLILFRSNLLYSSFSYTYHTKNPQKKPLRQRERPAASKARTRVPAAVPSLPPSPSHPQKRSEWGARDLASQIAFQHLVLRPNETSDELVFLDSNTVPSSRFPLAVVTLPPSKSLVSLLWRSRET